MQKTSNSCKEDLLAFNSNVMPRNMQYSWLLSSVQSKIDWFVLAVYPNFHTYYGTIDT